MTSDLWKAFAHLYPDAQPLVDYILQDDGDGRGPYLATWHLPGDPPDEQAALAAIRAFDAAAVDRATKQATKQARQSGDASGAVGKAVATLKQNELNALLELLLERAGALDDEGRVKPVDLW